MKPSIPPQYHTISENFFKNLTIHCGFQCEKRNVVYKFAYFFYYIFGALLKRCCGLMFFFSANSWDEWEPGELEIFRSCSLS